MIKLQQYKELLPFGALLMYMFGGIYYILYYMAFGINIIPYLSLTEVLIDAIIFCLSLALELIIFELILGIIIMFIYKAITKKELENNEYLPASFIIQMLLIFLFIFIDSIFFLFAPYALLLLIKMFLMIRESFSDEENKNGKGCLYSMIYLFAFLLLAFIYGKTAYEDAKHVLTGKDNFRIEIILKDKTYSTQTDKNLFYVGETSSHYFLYNIMNNNTIVINKENVIESILLNEAYGEKKVKNWLKRNEFHTNISNK